MNEYIVNVYIEEMKTGALSGFRHFRYENGQFIGNYFNGPRVVTEAAVKESIRASLAPKPNRFIRPYERRVRA